MAATQLSNEVLENHLIQHHLREMHTASYVSDFAAMYELSLAEQQALFVYTRLGMIMNQAVYNPTKLAKQLVVFQELNRFANQALSKLPDYQGEVIRYMHSVPDWLAQHQVGQIVTYHNLTSASVHGGVFSNRPVKITIQSKHGKLISGISALPQQQEVLFRSGSRFEVLSYTEQENSKIWIKIKELD